MYDLWNKFNIYSKMIITDYHHLNHPHSLGWGSVSLLLKKLNSPGMFYMTLIKIYHSTPIFLDPFVNKNSSKFYFYACANDSIFFGQKLWMRRTTTPYLIFIYDKAITFTRSVVRGRQKRLKPPFKY